MSFEEFQDGRDFSNSESLCHCDASHQVSAQSDLGFRKIPGGHLGYRNRTILAILVILSFLLTEEGQLSVSGESMCTILVNHLED